jgi:hypothetical protein
MICQNFFAPIAFMYRRAIWKAVGGYNEALPVLGDWFFNMEFLLHADIGVLHEPLAFYHHRDRGDSSKTGVYANSVIGGRPKHEEFAAIARNEFFRRNMTNAAGVAAMLGYMLSEIRSASNRLQSNASVNANSKAGIDHDKLWIIANLNSMVSKWPDGWLYRLKGVKALEPDASWDQINAVLSKRNIEIPIPPDFDEQGYLALNQDVAAACGKGMFRTGYEHYLLLGRKENRPRRDLRS